MPDKKPIILNVAQYEQMQIGDTVPVINGGTGVNVSTGSGSVVLNTSPTLVTPILGVASSTSETVLGTGGGGFLQLNTQSSAPITPSTNNIRLFSDASGRLSWKASSGFIRTFDGSSNTADRIYVLPDLAGTIALVNNNLSSFAATTSAQLASVISDETGSGSLVFATSPTFVTPLLGTPTSCILTNCTALPLSTGITGTLAIANGGTGQGTANAAINALLPLQTTNSGKVLTTNGVDTSWVTSSGYSTITLGSTALTSGSTITTIDGLTQITNGILIGGATTTSALRLRSTSGVGVAGADIIFQTGSNGATEAMRILNAGNVIIGATTLVAAAGEMFSVQKNQNAFTQVYINNSTNGAGAGTLLSIGSNTSNNLQFGVFSAAYTTTGSTIANSARIQSSFSGGLNITTNSAAQIAFWTNNIERWRVDINGSFTNIAATGNTTALLQIDSTSKGFLPPRMTSAQRVAIASPAVGLIVYQTDSTENLYINKSTGWAIL